MAAAEFHIARDLGLPTAERLRLAYDGKALNARHFVRADCEMKPKSPSLLRREQLLVCHPLQACALFVNILLDLSA